MLFGPPFITADRRSITAVLRGKRVFVYDRKSFSRSASSSPAGVPDFVLSPQHLSFPTRESLAPSHGSLRELAEADNPLLRALAEFEREFFVHVNVTEVLLSGGESRLAACTSCLTEQQRVMAALRAAQDNLRDNNEALSGSFARLWPQVRASHRRNQAILDNFEHSLAQTAELQLHEALQQIGRASCRERV